MIGIGGKLREALGNQSVCYPLNVLSGDAEPACDLGHRLHRVGRGAEYLPARLSLPCGFRDLVAATAQCTGQFIDIGYN